MTVTHELTHSVCGFVCPHACLVWLTLEAAAMMRTRAQQADGTLLMQLHTEEYHNIKRMHIHLDARAAPGV